MKAATKAPILNRRLTLEALTRTPDGAGGYAASWETLGVIWGAIAPGTGREAAGGGAALSRVVVKIMVRAAPVGALSRPAAGQRLREGARLWQIHAVNEADARGRWLVLTAEEELVR